MALKVSYDATIVSTTMTNLPLMEGAKEAVFLFSFSSNIETFCMTHTHSFEATYRSFKATCAAPKMQGQSQSTPPALTRLHLASFLTVRVHPAAPILGCPRLPPTS